jgi:serine phosphatase RsbU (regulator of sigma subunit)/CHASE2 domain-containing sensor protein
VRLTKRRWLVRLRRLVPLLYLIPLAYLLRPVFWSAVDARYYNYFHSKRSVPPWTEVVVVGIDRDTRENAFDKPIYPLSRHTELHGELTRKLDEAGARAIVFDLMLGPDVVAEPPLEFAEACRISGKVYLVMTMLEEKRVGPEGDMATLFTARLPDSTLMDACKGVYVVDVSTDPDGTVRRFTPDRRLSRLGLETLPEHLSGHTLSGSVPVEFPSLDRPMPQISYRDVLAEDESALSKVDGRIAFVGLTEETSRDFVSVPRLQDLGQGIQAFGLPGVIVLASITETLSRGAPIRDAGWLLTTVWIVVWCVLAVLVLPRRRPALAVIVLGFVLLLAIAATGVFHAKLDLVFPAGLVIGSVFLCGLHRMASSYIQTTKELHAEEIENERIRHEMEVARRTQERFLPKEIPTIEGADLWGTNISSATVSGDYFDIIELGDSRPLLMVIADVSGKGLPASLVMSNVQAGLHSQALQQTVDLKVTAENLNRLVCENTDAGTFVTLFIGELDKESWRMRYVRAGHDVPLLVSSKGTVSQLSEGGLMLGFSPEIEYDVSEVQLSKGDLLCLYTDGITEARDPSEEEFGVARLVGFLTSHRTESAEQIGQALIKSVQQFSRVERQMDDMTLIMLKIAGTSET